MNYKSLKSIAAVAAVSAGVLFAGSQSADASTKITVKAGDTLSQLAQTYNVSVNDLQQANHIQDINKIYAGETFVFGDDGNVQVAPAASATAQAATPAQPQQQPQAAPQPAAQPVAPQQPQTQAAAPQPAAPAQPAQAAKPAPAAAPQPAAKPAVQAQPARQTTNNAPVNNDGSMDSIARVESGGSYTARNGQYIGKYQLSASYLNGDYSPANQERVARQYAISRYGSVQNAVNFRASHSYW
ncbi:LysM peptidoglycan-binding domain-containing protein [Fructilactobacillus florum]|nr:LysM domain-containing protein [Fructilactobacillus florum]